jgi:hypothetical protein
MVAPLARELVAVPHSVVDAEGKPNFGSFLGTIGRVDLSKLGGTYRRSWLYRKFHLKKWRWLMVATPEVAVGFAIVDVNYAANGFLFAIDLASRKVLSDASALGIPGATMRVGDFPDEGADESFTSLGLRMSVKRPAGRKMFEVSASNRNLQLEALLDAGASPTPLTAITPVQGGVVNVTQKSVCLPASGTLICGDRRYDLSGGFGGFDYTHGLLARHTAWRWAFATGVAEGGKRIGLNLTAGFNEGEQGGENVLWVDGATAAVGPARFGFEAKSTQSPWRIVSEDNRVDLTFVPQGEHREERNLVVAKSYFVQVFGVFHGTVNAGSGPIKVAGLPGVAEDQRITW